MALLIDGYNLMHATSIFATEGSGTVLHRTRMALLDFLAGSMKKRERVTTTVVFDAAGAPPGLPQTIQHDGMTIHFARRNSSADEMIEELIEQAAAPKSLMVVSGDHRVQRAARRRGAKFVDSDRWYAELRAARRAADKSNEATPTKPSGQLSPEQLAYWMGEFSDAAPAEGSSDDPFPPGYADDLLEEE